MIEKSMALMIVGAVVLIWIAIGIGGLLADFFDAILEDDE